MIISLALIILIFGHGMSAPKTTFKCQPVSGINYQLPEIEGTSQESNLINTVLSDDYIASNVGIHKVHATERTDWNAARNTCLNENAQLVIIDSPQEETALNNYLQENNITDAWIGVHDFFMKDDWTTVRGSRLSSLNYVNWALGEPNNADGNEHCVHYSSKSKGLNDLACNRTNFFVCERFIAAWNFVWTSP